MPSISGSARLEDGQSACPHAANLMRADVTHDKTVSDKAGAAETVAGDRGLSTNGDNDKHDAEGNSHNESELKDAAGHIKWIRPDLPSRCTWRPDAPISESPHSHPPK